MGSWVTGRWRPDSSSRDAPRQFAPVVYQAYVADRIAELDMIFPASLVQTLTDAERAIAELQHITRDSAFPTLRQLAMLEAMGSGRLSGLVTSARRLAEVSGGHSRHDPAAQRVAAIAAASAAIVAEDDHEELSLQSLERVHACVLGSDVSRVLVRSRQMWVGTSRTPRSAEFVPPPPGHLEELVGDLCAFVNREDLPPLAQAAIAHAQFLTICPFWDGNGRTGRWLIHAILHRRGLLRTSLPPVSSILAVSRRSYLDSLAIFRNGHITEYCAEFAHAVKKAASEAVRLTEQCEEVLNHWRKKLGRVRSGSAAERLLRVLLERPVVDPKLAEDALAVSDEAARLGLISLEKAGIVRRLGGSAHGRIAVADDALDLIERWEYELEL